MERPALQNKQVVILRMAFRARKVLGIFEKRAPGLIGSNVGNNYPVGKLLYIGKALFQLIELSIARSNI